MKPEASPAKKIPPSPFRTPEARAYFSAVGKLGGSVASKAQAEAARLNGKKGGRPPGKSAQHAPQSVD